jgi:hypothetical protein
MPCGKTGYWVKWLDLCGEEALLLLKSDGQYELRRKRHYKKKANKDRLEREIEQQTGIEKIVISNSFSVWSLYKDSGVWVEGFTWVFLFKGDPKFFEAERRFFGWHSPATWVSMNQIQDNHIYRKYGLGDFVYRPNKPKNDENSIGWTTPPAGLCEGDEIVGEAFEEEGLNLGIIFKFDPILPENVIADDFSWNKDVPQEDYFQEELERQERERLSKMFLKGFRRGSSQMMILNKLHYEKR